jgi:hypothetical protein
MSASQVAGIIGVSHQLQALKFFFNVALACFVCLLSCSRESEVVEILRKVEVGGQRQH